MAERWIDSLFCGTPSICRSILTMRLIVTYLALAAVASAAAVEPRAVSYDGFKVVRIPVGTDASKVTEIVNKLQLKTWKGAPKAGAFADIMVPPSQIEAFNTEIAGMEAVTMHEDLGASIAEESNYAAYAGEL